ncbi:MAG: peptidylprolyl isomerase [Candidatus Sumerlaeota bacterium]|nr:peptidylprolyl isomerase [Candidatus Sumerlaeota bacterium]
MRKKIIGDQPKPSEDEMKEYYEKNKAIKYTNTKQYDISLIGLKIGEPGQKQDPKEREERIAKNKKRLGEILPSLKTKQDFEKTAQEMSEDPTGPHKGAVGLIPATYHNGFDGRLEKMKVDNVSEPFEFGNFVYLLRVNNIKPEEVRSFEDCKRLIYSVDGAFNQLENDLMNEHQRTVLSAKKEEILKAGEYEFLMKD